MLELCRAVAVHQKALNAGLLTLTERTHTRVPSHIHPGGCAGCFERHGAHEKGAGWASTPPPIVQTSQKRHGATHVEQGELQAASCSAQSTVAHIHAPHLVTDGAAQKEQAAVAMKRDLELVVPFMFSTLDGGARTAAISHPTAVSRDAAATEDPSLGQSPPTCAAHTEGPCQFLDRKALWKVAGHSERGEPSCRPPRKGSAQAQASAGQRARAARRCDAAGRQGWQAGQMRPQHAASEPHPGTQARRRAARQRMPVWAARARFWVGGVGLRRGSGFARRRLSGQ